jgi:hypothetical protein
MTGLKKRMSNALALGGAALLGLAMTSGTAAAQRHRGLADGPHLNTCHSALCSWFDITSFTMVRETSNAALIRLSMREGNSEQRPGRYPRSSHGVHIQWEEVNGDTYVFCSTRLPAVIYKGGDVVSVTSVDPGNPDVPTDAVTAIYNHVCHHGVQMTPARARRLGYHGGRVEGLELQRPEDIFDRAR